MFHPSLFDEPPRFDRAGLAGRLRKLAAQNILIGTSSWKYEGWLGQIYNRDRYVTRGKFSRKRFEETCLQEYGQDQITLSFNTTNDPFNVESNSLILAMWQDAFGQLDGSITFKLTHNISLTADAQNLLNHKLYYFVGDPSIPRAYYNNGRTFWLGGKLNF